MHTAGIALLLGLVYNHKTPELYDNNVHSKIGWVITWIASAWAFTIVALIALFYSMGLYLWRVDNIKKRRAVTYHDKWGPSFLCAGLVIAVAISFGYRFAKGGEGGLRDGMKG